MSNFTLFALVISAVGALALLQYLLMKKWAERFEKTQEKDTALILIQQQINGLRDHVRQNLDGSTKIFEEKINFLTQQVGGHLQNQGQILQQSHEGVGKRIDNAARVVGELQNRLGKLEEATTRIFDVGKDIASLQEILRSPKLRGSLGELFLGDLLGQLLPAEHFEIQHSFKNGEKVDAIVKLGGHFVPVDSKFPLENFKKYVDCKTESEKKAARKLFLSDVKKHIDAIAQKYIRPDEGTFDFALMYIPAENVYYEMVIREEAFDAEFSVMAHAMSKRVIPVSPNNFYVYLNTILLGLKGMKVEQSAKEIQANLARLQGDLKRVSDDFGKIGTHLNNARSAYETVDKRLTRLGERFETLALPEEKSIHPVLQEVN